MRVNSLTITSIVLEEGDSLELISDANTTYYAVGGTAQFKHSTAFKNGTKWERHPSGSLTQWGTMLTDATGKINIVYPIAFATAAYTTTFMSDMTIIGSALNIATTGTQWTVRTPAGAAVGAGIWVHYISKGY